MINQHSLICLKLKKLIFLDVFTEIKKEGSGTPVIPIVSDGRKDGQTELLMPHEIRFINQRVANIPEEEKKNVLKQWIEVENPRFENWMVITVNLS
jgi:hypothetical protein